MAVSSGKIIQNVFVCRNRQLDSTTQFAVRNSLPYYQARKLLTWRRTGFSAMQLRTLTTNNTDHGNRGGFYCNAVSASSATLSLEKVDFSKLQNG
ncbi:hypothetical protein MKX03_036625, partial [Papaver bracteatum]